MRSELLATGLPDVAAFWGEYGRPGWIANRWLDGEAVWNLAGEVRGTYRVEEPGRAPRRLIDPAGAGSFTPLSWYDSLQVRPGVGAAWQGFSGAMMTVEGRTGGAGPAGAEGIVDLRSGDGSWDENSLMVSRRDSVRWLRIESHGLARGPAGTMDAAGRHLWGISGGGRRGSHSVELAFAQQGVAGRLLGTEQEDLNGQVGSGTYRYDHRGRGSELTFARGRSRAVSFSDLAQFPYSRRATAATEVTARAWHPSGFSLGAQLHREEAARDYSDTFNTRIQSFWGVAGWKGELAGGTLSVDLGAGKHDAFSSINVAPAVYYETRMPGMVARVGGERILNAVWNEMALNQAPFLQRSLVGVADVTLGIRRAKQVRGVVLAGRTSSRAVASRTPLSELVLRRGLIEDLDPYTFALVSGEARVPWRRWFGSMNAFGLVRAARAAQANVDPDAGARAMLGGRWHPFRGDLGIEAWVGSDVVGPRSSEISGLRLPAYAVSSAGLLFTLEDAVITIRFRDIENRSAIEPWEDTSSVIGNQRGTEALGPGREIRFALTLNLSN